MHLLRLGLFALAALSPVLLLALAVLQGGLWCGLALIYMGLAALTLDTLLPLASAQGDDREFPVADVLLVALGLCSLALLPGLTWAIAGPGPLGASGRIALLVAGGLWFGQVAHPAAHELIHRPRPLFWLGLSVYTSLLFGHHTSSHR